MKVTSLGKWNTARLKRAATLLLYPEPKHFPEGEWRDLLSRAIRCPLAAATTLNVMRFFLAIPLLMLFAGPFMPRRTRRGLDTPPRQQESASDAKAYLKEVSHE